MSKKVDKKVDGSETIKVTKREFVSAIMGMYMNADITEGYASKALDLERVDFREIYRLWAVNAPNAIQ